MMADEDGEPPKVLTTRELQSRGIEVGTKMVLVSVDDAMYKREGDGKWYRLQRGMTPQ